MLGYTKTIILHKRILIFILRKILQRMPLRFENVTFITLCIFPNTDSVSCVVWVPLDGVGHGVCKAVCHNNNNSSRCVHSHRSADVHPVAGNVVCFYNMENILYYFIYLERQLMTRQLKSRTIIFLNT